VQRVIAYIDGYNLYYGLREKGWKQFYWLNVQALVKRLLKEDQELVFTKYFTAMVKLPEDKRKRQELFLEALETLDNLRIYYGHYLSNPVTCQQCGHSYETHHEKQTDVNIAVEMMKDAFQDSFDTALLVSGDSDLAGVVRTILDMFPCKRVVVAFPPRRISSVLRSTASAYVHIGRDSLSKSVFPDEVIKSGDHILRRPDRWR